MRFRGLNLQAGGWEAEYIGPFGANVIRVGVRLGVSQDLDALRWCLNEWATLGIKIIPVCWVEVQGFADTPVFYDSNMYQALVSFWVELAREFKGNEQIAAFDLLNEPSHRRVVGRWTGWNWVARWLVDIIRGEDPSRVVVLEPLHGDPKHLRNLTVRGPKIWYSPHVYAPTTYTHQGILRNSKGELLPWKPISFDDAKVRLLSSIKTIKRFQTQVNAETGRKPPILVGEFSAVRWAEGASRYLSTAIAQFEANNWHWCYHTLWPSFASTTPAFTEQPWDLNAEPAPERKEAVLQGLSLNN